MTNTELRIETLPLAPGAVVVRPKGNIDAHTYSALETALNAHLSKGIYDLVVDMTDVDYLASAGIGVLLSAQSISHEHRGNVVLMNIRSSVASVLELLGIDEVFQVATDRASALACLSHRAA
ncbi:MAG TPA: STAS domain-containing protein [Planctomycetota bacterium]|nr:STAS domain-containing protein [Planctomycetota bacterium]